MTTPTEAPPNCETCENLASHRRNYCNVLNSEIPTTHLISIREHGCLFHPRAREWLNRDVIEELSDQINALENMEPERGSENWCAMQEYKRAITLLRGGEGE